MMELCSLCGKSHMPPHEGMPQCDPRDVREFARNEAISRIVCGDHWHGLSGEMVDGSDGCPWCRSAKLEAELSEAECNEHSASDRANRLARECDAARAAVLDVQRAHDKSRAQIATLLVDRDNAHTLLKTVRARLDKAPVAEAREFLSLDDEDMHRACRLLVDLADAVDACLGKLAP